MRYVDEDEGKIFFRLPAEDIGLDELHAEAESTENRCQEGGDT